MAEVITLQLNASSRTRESIAGWQVETFTLTAAARAAGQAPTPVPLEPDAVLELELQNGTRLLVAAEDAERYLGRAVGRGAGVAAAIEVGPVLRPSGTYLPAGPSREGLGAWVLKSLRVYQQGPAGMTALAAAGAFQDSQLDDRNGLFRLSIEPWALTPVDKMPSSADPVLLFLHGTASSTERSFRGLWGGKGTEVDARRAITETYGGRVYGFEHRSLTESPIANALALAKTLPKNARLHLVSHSRGGLVGELLARASRLDVDPFPEVDIQRFLEHAKATGREGFEEDGERLRELNKVLKGQEIRVERFVRVAAPIRGTTLASGRLDRWASVMLNLFGGGLSLVPGVQTVTKGYELLQTFLRAVVKKRTDARLLPGLEAMMPDSPLVALLNASDVEIDSPVHVIAGDYQGEALLSWLVDGLAESFYVGPTDLVVNTPSMSGGAGRRQGIWLKSLEGAKVHHLNYFEREDSASPMLQALKGSNDPFQQLEGPSTTQIARGGKRPIPRADAPLALVLPGIMGSQLAAGSDRIWFAPLDILIGEMDRLEIKARGVSPAGWIDRTYEGFAQHLSRTHEVRPFTYDWRLSIRDAAKKFGKVLDEAMTEAEKRRKPLRIVAHSMGGLVARLALHSNDRWSRLKAMSGGRLVQFGTPNMGSHSMATVLTGRDSFVQMIERLDWRHDMREFLDIVRHFPGVLELLPWPLQNDQAMDGVNYFDPRQWQTWSQEDAENRRRIAARGGEPQFERKKGAGDGWYPPDAEPLQQAKQAVDELLAAPVDPACTLYVAGKEKTPVALRVVDGQVEVAWTLEGDGRVPWKTGIPPGVRAWYVDAAHGDLLKHQEAFAEYVSLLETGNCRLPTTPIGARDAGGAAFAPARLAGDILYPSPDDVLTAATGGRPRRARAKIETVPVTVELVHGSLAGADSPVLIGSYANDPLRGSALFLDRLLGGRLARAEKLGRYPEQLGEALVFQNPAPGAKPGGAVVVGLGALGGLTPGGLTRSLVQGFLEYARISEQARQASDSTPRELELSTLLVGTGYAGLSVELAMRCLVDALSRAARALAETDIGVRIGRLCLFEEDEARAVAAADALREVLQRESRFQGNVNYDGRIRLGQGRYRGYRCDQGGANGWYRVHITADDGGSLRFTLVTDRARNEVDEEPDQRQAVDGLIRSATQTTTDQPGLARALFELMVPNGFKEALPDVRGVILGVNAGAAVYPWEFMRDESDREPPLATRIGLVRQLASPHGRQRVVTVGKEHPRLLVVGDTQSGFEELRGAQEEAAMVARLFQEHGHEVNLLQRPDGQTVLVNLFDGHYRLIHLAAHGIVAEDDTGYTGMVLGPNTYLTTAQISKLRRVPEVVFINCCHLGNMTPDARPRWGQLAANLATEFIEMGCKAVVAAGWAVDDAAAATFAGTFYRGMLDGERFGEAVWLARAETQRRHPATNTWGAYQAYGDERYCLIEELEDKWEAPDYLHAGQVTADLEQIGARIGPATADERKMYEGRLKKIEDAARARSLVSAEVHERLADAWAALDRKEQAIAHYRESLAHPDARVSLHALEQLANLECRRGAELIKQERQRADELLTSGVGRLEQLLALGKTTERLSLLGSCWKRRGGGLLAAGADGKEVTAALEKMQQWYRDASEHALECEGERDYYPTLNVLDAAIVLAGRGNAKAKDELESVRADWLADAARNARHRYLGERSFFHAYGEVEAARVDALWACLDGRENEALTQDDIRRRLVARHRDLFARLGDAREHDSALGQVRWLIDMLPEGGPTEAMREALKKLLTEIQAD